MADRVALTVSDAQGTCSTRVRKIVADGKARDTARRVDIRSPKTVAVVVRYPIWQLEARDETAGKAIPQE